MRSCEWKAFCAREKPKVNQNYCFLGQPTVKESDILDKIQSDEFFGLCKVDVFTPPEVIEKYHDLNFPLIFR